MKDGYYLSTYIHIGELAHYFRLEIRHDQNIALWKYQDGKLELVRYWELERITGIKHHAYSFATKKDFDSLLNNLLSEFGLQLNDIEEIWDHREENNSVCTWYHQISYHNLAHVFSAMLNSTNDFHQNNILVIAVDGGPDSIDLRNGDVNFSGVYSTRGVIKGFEQLCSPGPLWSWAKKLFGLEEGSLMALMSASRSELIGYSIDANLDIVDFASGIKSYEIIKQISSYVWSLTDSDEGKRLNFWDKKFARRENCISMSMKVIFDLSCKIMFRNVEKMIKGYNISPQDTMFSVVGGYGLNCLSNTILMNKYGFKKFIEVPCTNDSGISLGIGLLETFRRNQNFSFNFNKAYYGNEVDWCNEKEISNNPYVRLIESNYSKEKIYNDLLKGPIIWVSGEMEIGPRALGHRSLLALTRKIDKDRLNCIKQRQWWRPVAPIVAADKVNNWFIARGESRFMLKTYQVKSEFRKNIPAICHLDNSARVQTVSESDDKDLYELLRMVEKKTGIPILCNTSLNDLNEVIINSICRCISFAVNKEIEVIYADGKRIEINHNPKNIGGNLQNGFNDIDSKKENYSKKKSELNPNRLSIDELQFFVNTKSLHSLDIKDSKDARIVKKMYAHVMGGIVQDLTYKNQLIESS